MLLVVDATRKQETAVWQGVTYPPGRADPMGRRRIGEPPAQVNFGRRGYVRRGHVAAEPISWRTASKSSDAGGHRDVEALDRARHGDARPAGRSSRGSAGAGPRLRRPGRAPAARSRSASYSDCRRLIVGADDQIPRSLSARSVRARFTTAINGIVSAAPAATLRTVGCQPGGPIARRDDRARTGGIRGAQARAEVVRILHAVEHEQQRRARRGGRAPPRGASPDRWRAASCQPSARQPRPGGGRRPRAQQARPRPPSRRGHRPLPRAHAARRDARSSRRCEQQQSRNRRGLRINSTRTAWMP